MLWLASERLNKSIWDRQKKKKRKKVAKFSKSHTGTSSTMNSINLTEEKF